MMRPMRRVSVVAAAGIPLGAGECGKRFQPARGHFVPWDERVGIEFELHQGIPTGMGSEDFFEEFDFLEDVTFTESFCGCLFDEEGQVFRQNQG